MPRWLDSILGRSAPPAPARQVDAVTVRVPTVRSILGMTPEQMYSTQPALRAVVDFLAREVASVPLHVYRMGGRGRERDREGVAAKLLERPNPAQTGYELMEGTVLDLKLRGFALWFVYEDADSASGWGIRQVPAAWVMPAKTIDTFSAVSYTVRNPTAVDASEVDLPAASCIRFAATRPGFPLGAASPVEALKDVLAEQVSSWAFRNQVWRNGGRITSYLYRPPQVPWSEGAFDRFSKEWHEYGGNEGANAGKTPIFEDGMEYRTVTFNAKEAEWAEATKLSRQDVAGVYHVNPGSVWANDGQTYASVKENARMLYVDCLGPDLKMIQDRITQFLLPMVGAQPGEYAEFEIQSKLAGSFEEQAQVIQSAVGAPWMSRMEARERFNLPYIDGSNELVTPLNVLIGGQASPTDAAPDGFLARALLAFKDANPDEPPELDEPLLKSRGRPGAKEGTEMAAVLRRHFKRQRKDVLSKMGRDAKAKANGDPAWWNSERWDSELAAELLPVFESHSAKAGRRAMRELGLAGAEYDEGRTEEYLKVMARKRAEAVNAVTLKQLKRALDPEGFEDNPDAQGATPEGVFDKAEGPRADTTGVSFATAVAAWGVMEAARQSGKPHGRIAKTWIVTSGNPRASHAGMDGETVPFDEPFSNGAFWPGDTDKLDEDETCGCQCDVVVTIS